MSDRLASRNKNRTLVNLLQERASQHPDRTAYTFLEDGERESDTLTYRQLDEKARAIAAYLQAQLSVGDRVLLVYPQGLEAIAALFGCLYAGMIAIPAPAPETARLKRTLPRLEAIAADAGASLILTTASLLTKRDGNLTFQAKSFVGRIQGRSSLLLHYYLAAAATAQETALLHERMNHPHPKPFSPGRRASNSCSLAPGERARVRAVRHNAQETSQLATLPWTATETIPTHLATYWQPPDISGDTLAYLQYTSGSTSTPKGVMLDHVNLMGHLAALQQAVGYDSNSITVTWMPYFHDYGLVEGILEPLYNGTPCYLMSPTAFIKQPLRWLKAIAHYGATHSQAPNFAYAYCLKRITTAERDTLDLSRWQAAGNAAEPINPEVMEEFCQTFEPCGFRQSAFAPAYGLAEATLLVTTSRKLDAPVFCTVDVEATAQNRLVETPTGHRLAGSGRLLAETQVVIVHPETLTRCAPVEVGEIWVASVGVARGYWQRPDATQETFCAALADTGEGPFLRTGDLGFLKDGELFVTGRLKDLIVIRGENYYPQDIEWVVEKSHPALRSSYGASFAVEVDGVEQVVIAFEVDRTASKNLNIDEVVAAIRNAVAENYELPIYGIVLLKRGSILKTSSGKIQRQACRTAFLNGSLASLAIWKLNRASIQRGIIPQNQIEAQLVQIWQRVLGVSSISTKDNFFELGGDSLKAAVVTAEVEMLLKQEMPLALLATVPTIEQLAFLLCQKNKNVGIRSLVPVKPGGSKRPFFYIHGLLGYNSDVNFALARHIDSDRPMYGVQAIGVDPQKTPHTDMQEMVSHYIQEIQTVQPEDPYLVGGISAGGSIAFEVAQQLQRQGQKVQLLVMVDTPNPYLTKHEINTLRKQVALQIPDWAKEVDELWRLNHVELLSKLSNATLEAVINHSPKVYYGQVVYLAAEKSMTEGFHFDPMQPQGWNSLIANGINLHNVPGNHFTMHCEPHIRVLAEKLNACLEKADHASAV
ncbi:MAG: AMP-binding protein [Stenomitos rutilans HA7619-LM2]|jgi:acyl-CoA synthetase (AMP-forming)/AMP-acid ligase II/thioesterase domain-containing protein/acyl carrier protein|nr:AMP-binding protein [Stenomitos rutilans HA7619-LM2]